jgi:hypothetical protein
MGRLGFLIWISLAVTLAVLAGFQTSDDLAEMFSVMSTFAAGGAFASLLSIVRLRARAPALPYPTEDRLHELETRVALTEVRLSTMSAQRDFERRIRDGIGPNA